MPNSESLVPSQNILDWLLAGDVSIQYQTYRDLLGEDRPELRERIASEGWGKRFLDARNPDGTWGRGFYQPKWTNSHYTLLDLRNLAIAPDHRLIRKSVHAIALGQKAPDGGIDPSVTIGKSDVCINGMYLNYACYFGEPESELRSIVDFILDQYMEDGGFNCRRNRSGAVHSSVHSTVAIMEGITEYEHNGYAYRLSELLSAFQTSRDFLLQHRLFKSDKTGEVIHKQFLQLSYPTRWKYNILRALDALTLAECSWDDRMQDAIDVILSKRKADGRWPLQAAHPGDVHFRMEEPRQPSRWNTLIALRVLKAFGKHPT